MNSDTFQANIPMLNSNKNQLNNKTSQNALKCSSSMYLNTYLCKLCLLIKSIEQCLLYNCFVQIFIIAC